MVRQVFANGTVSGIGAVCQTIRFSFLVNDVSVAFPSLLFLYFRIPASLYPTLRVSLHKTAKQFVGWCAGLFVSKV
ncbi:hypothetical protein GBG21_01540 [Aeribacillus pallidus]|uniref:hypothetical protein n=1 Tax=Aeribacillus composti TaxID=1868734 RepID=UPI002E1AFDF3|nr:hypothetical protein [Aeribacillus composti]